MRFFAPPQTRCNPPSALPNAIARRYGFDPFSALTSRVGQTSAPVLKMFKEAGMAAPKPHSLTDAERRKLASAFAVLPPLHQRVLQAHLRRVSFLDGMPNTALTSPVNPDTTSEYPLFDITIRAGILHQTASEWLTEKERSIFDATGSDFQVFIEAGKNDALVFVLLHEATHIVDLTLGITSPAPFGKQTSKKNAPPTAFTKGIWIDRTQLAPSYRDALRERIRFYAGGKPLPIAQASVVYASLQKTPFVSLYGGSNRGDDLAEYVAVYHWTHVLKQPYRIVLRDGEKEVLTYEPMASLLVRGRLPQMQQFYAPEKSQ